MRITKQSQNGTAIFGNLDKIAGGHALPKLGRASMTVLWRGGSLTGVPSGLTP